MVDSSRLESLARFAREFGREVGCCALMALKVEDFRRRAAKSIKQWVGWLERESFVALRGALLGFVNRTKRSRTNRGRPRQAVCV